MNNVWVRVLRRVKRTINRHSFETWIKSMHYEGYRKGVLRLTVLNDSHRNWVNENYLSLIRVAAGDICSRDVEVQISLNGVHDVEEKAPAVQRSLHKAPVAHSLRQGPALPHTNGDFTFDNYVLGECNEFAHAACVKVAQSPSKAYNPLFIYGQDGVGKTHLLSAITHYIRHNHQALSVLYETAEDFTNDLVDSIGSRQMPGFRARYRNQDVFLIDDIQFIQAKKTTQESLLHTFNALYDLGRQIVVSCDRHPEGLQFVQDKLLSRLGSGLVVDLAPPDLEVRVRILLKKAEKVSFDLPEEIAYYMASRAPSNVRQLESLLTRVKAYTEWKHLDLTLESAKAALNGYGKLNSQEKLSTEVIQNKVALYYGLRTDDLLSRSRARNIVRARQVAMFLCRELLRESYPSIGRSFSGMSHAAAMHSCGRVVFMLKSDPRFVQTIDVLKKELADYGPRPKDGGQLCVQFDAKT
ncbi:MAG TPA: chromosomal replication initiator protein DnaA [bacterium]|nr:chromosomal replication initiator protein DnaA [bacterium]